MRKLATWSEVPASDTQRARTRGTNYAAGRRAEYRARDELRKLGYFVVRSAGSHGSVDLVALPYSSGRAVLVQVKRGRLARADLDELARAVLPAEAIVELWHYAPGGRRRYRRVGTDMLPLCEDAN